MKVSNYCFNNFSTSCYFRCVQRMFTCKFGPPISGVLAVMSITLPLLYLMTKMADRENAYYGSTATDNAVLGALIFMELGAIVVMNLQVKEFCIGTSAIPLSFLGILMLNFIVSSQNISRLM